MPQLVVQKKTNKLDQFYDDLQHPLELTTTTTTNVITGDWCANVRSREEYPE